MIFLSHNSNDKPIVRQIAQTLSEVYGQDKVFYDEWSIQPGDSIIENMNVGLESCNYFFFFISANSLKSTMVKLEWQAALIKKANQKQIKFIPVRIDNSIIPAIIAPTLYIDLFTHGLDIATRQIIDVINGQNTFRRNNQFSNLIAYIKYDVATKIEICICAEYYIEPHSRYLLVVDNNEEDLSWKLPDFNVMTTGFNKDISFSNGIHNCILIEVDSPTTPNFPVKIELNSKNQSIPIKLISVMKAISRTDFESIPLKYTKGGENDL